MIAVHLLGIDVGRTNTPCPQTIRLATEPGHTGYLSLRGPEQVARCLCAVHIVVKHSTHGVRLQVRRYRALRLLPGSAWILHFATLPHVLLERRYLLFPDGDGALGCDVVGIHTHRAVLRHRRARRVRPCAHRNAADREDASPESSLRAQNRGASDLPEDVAAATASHGDGRAARGGERALYLEDVQAVRVALSVESERSAQRRRRGVAVDSRRECETSQAMTCQVFGA